MIAVFRAVGWLLKWLWVGSVVALGAAWWGIMLLIWGCWVLFRRPRRWGWDQRPFWR